MPGYAGIATACVLLCALLLGGGTHPGFLSDVVLQVVSACALCVALSGLQLTKLGAIAKWGVCILILLCLVPLVQLVPLPPGLLGSAGNLQVESDSLARLGSAAARMGWRPLSVSPEATWLALLAGLPAVAVFVGVCQVSSKGRRNLSLLVVAFAMVSVFLGFLQVAQGQESPLRFYPITNSLDAVGFFANRNHFAAFLYVALVLSVAWTMQVVRRFGQASGSKRWEAGVLLPLLACFLVIVLLIAAATFTRSRAGLGLTLAALLSGGLLALRIGEPNEGASTSGFRWIVAAGALGALSALQLTLYRLLERLVADPLQDGRVRFARNTIDAVYAYFVPVGAGMGTFVPIYALFERPGDLIVDVFANRAHNDILEVALEAGLLGSVVLGLFAVWYVAASVRAWSSGLPAEMMVDRVLPRAATIIIALLLLHSLVDYPLRTASMLTLLAFACALIVPAPLQKRERASATTLETSSGRERVRELASARSERPRQVSSPITSTRAAWHQAPKIEPSSKPADSQVAPATQGQRWGGDIEWPQAWRSADSSSGDGEVEGLDRNDSDKKESG